MMKTIPLRLLLGIAVALGAGLGISAGPADAQSGNPQQEDNKWEKRCLQREGSDVTFCETSYGQFVTTGDTKRWIANAGVQQVEGRDTPDLFFFVPLGVRLAPGLIFRVDESEPKQIPYSICLPRGCQAVVKIDNTVIDALKKGSQLRVQFQNAVGKTVPGWVTLSGFTKAYDGAPVETKTVTPPPPPDNAAAPGGKGDAPVQ